MLSIDLETPADASRVWSVAMAGCGVEEVHLRALPVDHRDPLAGVVLVGAAGRGRRHADQQVDAAPEQHADVLVVEGSQAADLESRVGHDLDGEVTA